MFEKYIWEKRILVVLGNKDIKSQQKIILDKVKEGILDRDLIVFGLKNKQEPYFRIEKEQVKKIVEKYSLNADDNVILIGKDGTIKRKWEYPVSAREIFELIDSMPMRKSEIRQRKGEK